MVKKIAAAALSIPMALTLLISPVAVNPGTAFANTTQVTIRSAETEEETEEGIEAGSYAKTGGIGLAPIIAAMGASSVACLTLAHRLGKDEPDGSGDMMP